MATTQQTLAWVLKRNRLFAPLLDTALKLGTLAVALGAAVALPMLVVFNAYLGQLNQPAVPASQAGDWVFLVLFSILVSVVFALVATVPASWTSLVRWNAPGVPVALVRQACGATALATILMIALTVAAGSRWILAGLAGATLLGGLAGGLVITRGHPPDRRTALACLGFAGTALMLVTWLASLWILLAPTVAPFAADWPLATLVGLVMLLVLMLAISIARPPLGIIVGFLITGYWVVEQAAPDGGTMIASGLYTANLGGGRPFHGPQPVMRGEVCNLGIDTRPALYVEIGGCTRAAAFRRLNALKGLGSLARRRMLRRWQAEAVAQRSGDGEHARVDPASREKPRPDR